MTETLGCFSQSRTQVNLTKAFSFLYVWAEESGTKQSSPDSESIRIKEQRTSHFSHSTGDCPHPSSHFSRTVPLNQGVWLVFPNSRNESHSPSLLPFKNPINMLLWTSACLWGLTGLMNLWTKPSCKQKSCVVTYGQINAHSIAYCCNENGATLL